jgi:putative ABC transport system permease protein
MLLLAFRNLLRRPLRSGLAVSGVAAAIAVLVCLWSFANGYERGLRTELDRMGLQMMLVPLGCPYDAAARVIKGRTLENSLPEAVLEMARRDPDVAIAAPLLMVCAPSSRGRSDIWVGLDESAVALKPWWQAATGQNWFVGENSVILGCDAAEIEMRAPGDSFFSPETRRQLRVAGVLKRSGTSDDSLYFVPLRTAQKMFQQTNRITAVAIRLRDPANLRAVSQRLQNVPGAQIVTLTEMMGTFLNLVGAARALLFSLTLVAVVVSTLSVLNTMLAAVVERSNELCILRAIGASRGQTLKLIAIEGLILTTVGSLSGIGLALLFGKLVEELIKGLVPLAPAHSSMAASPAILVQALAVGLIIGVLSSLFPAWRASKLDPAAALKMD